MIQINQLADEHKGDTAILVANGPSLENVPIGFLNEHPTIGMNRVTALLPWVPSYYTCIGFDQFDTQKKRDTMKPIIPLVEYAFLSRYFAWDFREDNVFSLLGHSSYRMPGVDKWAFSKTPLETLGVGGTMSYVALQLLYFMGFTTVLCVGLDGTYSGKWHWYKEKEFPDFKSGPGVYKTDEAWNLAASKTLNIARWYFLKDERRIVNLTPDSKFTMFETGDLAEFYDGPMTPTVGEVRNG